MHYNAKYIEYYWCPIKNKVITAVITKNGIKIFRMKFTIFRLTSVSITFILCTILLFSCTTDNYDNSQAEMFNYIFDKETKTAIVTGV